MERCDIDVVHQGGVVYGQRVPKMDPESKFTWAGQRYIERDVRIARLRDVLVSGNEDVISRAAKFLYHTMTSRFRGMRPYQDLHRLQ